MRISLLTTVLLGLPAAAAAQAHESTDAHLRNDCRLAAQVLTTGRPATHRTWALEVIDRCEQSGPVALSRAWTTVPQSRAAVDELLAPSVRIWDRRLYAALRSVARNTGESNLKRVAALSVLSSYAAPNSGIPLSELLDPRPDSAHGIRLTSVDYRPRTIGSEPLPETVADEVSRVLHELVESEPDSVVGWAARRLLRYVLVQGSSS